MTNSTTRPSLAAAATFGEDLEFLRRHTEVAVLMDPSGQAQVAVVPAYQARVMTSTADGPSGTGFGWVNRELIASGKLQPHINVFGGEDRFWMGPEGGQFSIFFAKGAPFDLEHWYTPAALDTEPFAVISKNTDRIVCRRQLRFTNYSGTPFDLEVNREVRLVNVSDALAKLGVNLPSDVKAVGFESVNSVKNTGARPWKKERGLLSIWVLGMLNASPETSVVIPFVTGPESRLGPVVNDTYFGQVPADRLVVKDGAIVFRADASYRSKIGISPRRAKSVMGSFDTAHGTLTLVEFKLPKGASDYVNSMWEQQKNPFGGDAVNSYNDGPPQPGAKQLGRFYELESSSPALALKPGESATHVHQTFHVQGGEAQLENVARAVLGVGVQDIINAFRK
ncbi:MAG: hypothetical protein HYY23_20060 [Verrucomicrobia bacterium]|nr:hypothetical protein [Verrucomicrobiota bacterium]